MKTLYAIGSDHKYEIVKKLVNAGFILQGKGTDKELYGRKDLLIMIITVYPIEDYYE